MTIIVSKDGQNSKNVEKTNFDIEDFLQKTISDNPQAIPLKEIREDIRLLILGREFPSNSGPIDAIGIDQTGEIYLVETKLYKNPDKRKVVAQVLDYGAALWSGYKSFDEFFINIENKVEQNFHVDFSKKVTEFFGIDENQVPDLIESMAKNLANGRFHFVVLMDELHDGLKNLIIFLNQNSQFDIFAVELDYYKVDEYEIMIPRLFGTEVRKTTGKIYERGVYDEEYHLDKMTGKTQELYQGFKSLLFSEFDDVIIVPTKIYIGFKHNNNFLYVEYRKEKLSMVLSLKKGELDDPEHLTEDVSEKGHHGNGHYRLVVNDLHNENVQPIMKLIRQAYNKN